MPDAYAIILGAAVWPGGRPSPTLRRRTEAAGRLYLEGKVCGIIATGGSGRYPPAEAEVMRDILLGLGIPTQAIILESHARSTRDNLAFAQRLLPPGAEAYIVTDRWHMPRARLIAQRIGLPSRAAPCGREGTTWRGTIRSQLRELAALAWEMLRPMR